MPGVFRPMNLTDVLTSLVQQSQPDGGDTISGLAGFAEVAEAGTVSETVTCTHSTPPGWGATTWGAFAWA